MTAKVVPEYLAAIALLIARGQRVTQQAIEEALAELKAAAEHAAKAGK